MEAARKANVMFVDDEKRVLSSMRALFRRDYNVHLANSGNEALELLEHQDMDVIVSDQRMPGMTGVDVLKACKTRAPRAMRILLTGYADKDAIEASINEGEVFRYLTKPCARDTLRETLALAVDAAGAGAPPSAEPPPLGAAARSDNEALPAPPGQSSATATGRAPVAPQAIAPDVRSAGRRSTLDRVRDTLQRGNAPRPAATELMVLSADQAFTQALEGALGMAYRLHAVGSIEQAIDVLGDNPIGVLITDMAINGDEVQSLTAELKHCVPELVTIVASDHSDAHRLIELINGGQVFRFLLKPIRPKQTAIWIDSAVGKHLELVENPSLLARHAVSAPRDSLFALGDRLLRSIAGRMLRLRGAGSPQGSEAP
ncbi:MAG: response regulator [Gammaproteobacteria bacterium]|nr:response regulator [Gammaproteobacteria bacterium]